MLTGHRPYAADSDVASILPVVNDPVPSVRAIDPALPRELDAVLDPNDGEYALLSASAVIDRNDWFLAWDKALEAGRWIVGDQIRLDLEIRLGERSSRLAAQSV